MSTTTTAIEKLAQDIYDLLIDNEFAYDERASNDWEFEWNKEHPSGDSSNVVVALSKGDLEVIRTEYNRNDVQLGAKDIIKSSTMSNQIIALITRN